MENTLYAEYRNKSIEGFKQSVLKSAEWVKAEWAKGHNHFAYRVADLQTAELLSKQFNIDYAELKQFIDSAYTV